jgi:hypothetical protein
MRSHFGMEADTNYEVRQYLRRESHFAVEPYPVLQVLQSPNSSATLAPQLQLKTAA